jgi:hypothetical protein
MLTHNKKMAQEAAKTLMIGKSYMVHITRHALPDKLMLHHPSPVRIILHMLHPLRKPAATHTLQRPSRIALWYVPAKSDKEA